MPVSMRQVYFREAFTVNRLISIIDEMSM